MRVTARVRVGGRLVDGAVEVPVRDSSAPTSAWWALVPVAVLVVVWLLAGWLA